MSMPGTTRCEDPTCACDPHDGVKPPYFDQNGIHHENVIPPRHLTDPDPVAATLPTRVILSYLGEYDYEVLLDKDGFEFLTQNAEGTGWTPATLDYLLGLQAYIYRDVA